MSVRQLSQDEINQIAAGEVITNAADVVKELVENAIDAQATKITIILQKSGYKLIEIRDNGIGISVQDLKLVLLPHTTSKLKPDNIYAITSLGFRGEGLFAINQSSQCTLFSSQHKYHNGCLEPAPMNKGTIVKVENLFKQLPGRYNFIKNHFYEKKKIIELLKPYVYIYPHINFKLKHNDTLIDLNYITKRAILKTFSHQQSLDTTNNNALSCQITIINSKTQLKSMVFVNKRPIYDINIIRIVKDYYHTHTGQNNIHCIVEINCPYNRVNVNVHPRKQSVQFNQIPLESLLQSAILKNKTVKQDRLLRYKKHVVHYNNPLELTELIDNYQYITQCRQRYILIIYIDYIIVIDQHAAHERILTEQITNNNIILQNLLQPEIFTVGYEDCSHLNQIIKYTRLNDKIMINAMADFLTLEQLRDIIHNCSRRNYWQKYFLDYVHKYGCNKSIRTGYKLSDMEAISLLKNLQKSNCNNVCNHGRPTWIKIDHSYLDKLFWRK